MVADIGRNSPRPAAHTIRPAHLVATLDRSAVVAAHQGEVAELTAEVVPEEVEVVVDRAAVVVAHRMEAAAYHAAAEGAEPTR